MDPRVAIVTGSASGIGAAVALELAGRGWRVVVNYSKSAQQAEETAARCGEAIAVRADVSDDAQCRALVQAALDKWGRLDALVNNAGTTKFVPHAQLDGLSGEDFQRIYATNVIGPFQMCRAAAPALRAARGAIVNVSSLAARLGSPEEYVDYAASKGALDTLTVGLAKEVAADGIRVNAVRPGFIYTEIHASGGEPGRVDRVKEKAPMKRGGRPEEVARAVLWLLSDEASYSTGTFIEVSGGL